jgi:hypothetical protein
LVLTAKPASPAFESPVTAAPKSARAAGLTPLMSGSLMVGGELLAASGHDVAIDVPDRAGNPAGPLGKRARDDGSHIGGGTDQPDRWKSLNPARAWSTSAGG